MDSIRCYYPPNVSPAVLDPVQKKKRGFVLSECLSHPLHIIPRRPHCCQGILDKLTDFRRNRQRDGSLCGKRACTICTIFALLDGNGDFFMLSIRTFFRLTVLPMRPRIVMHS